MLIERIHAGPRVTTLMRAGTPDDQVAAFVNAEFADRLGPRRARAPDIAEYREFLQRLLPGGLDALVAKDDETRLSVEMARERVRDLLASLDRAAEIGRTVEEDFQTAVERWRNDPTAQPVQYPTRLFEALTKHAKASSEVLKRTADDPDIRAFAKHANVNIQNNQGYSLQDVIEIALQLGEAMGHTREETSSAFARLPPRPAAHQRIEAIDVTPRRQERRD